MTESIPQVGIISTVRGLDDSFRTWLHVHLQQGIQTIYLVLDAPEEDLETARRLVRSLDAEAHVQLIENDAAHQARIRSLPNAGDLLGDAEKVVVARQMLNVGVVLERVLEDRLDWVLHLDSDEVVAPYTADQPLLSHLAAQPLEIDEVIYPNFEAVPTTEEVDDPFRDIQVFKKSPYYLRYREFEHLYTAWRGRSGKFKLFNAYITGKAALRLADVDTPFIPYSVHHFLPMRFAENVKIEDDGGPVVLHYPHCGLARFVGRFTGFNADRVDTYAEGGFTDDLYTEARRLVAAGEAEALPELYRRLVMLEDPGLRAKLERRGYVFTRDFLADLR